MINNKSFSAASASLRCIFFFICSALGGSFIIVFLGCGGSPKEDPAHATFLKYCTPCHGEGGKGDGYNSVRIDPKPKNLTDGEYMSTRTDEQLFDVISKGGASVAKSVFMPPWGHTLKEDQIHSLVQYIRTLHPKVKLEEAPPPEEEEEEELF
ncbi:c-type cytochrome [candidate division TA06 bacterium]|nr:c-type cytochrome [candidate division TA06 bacterium]